MLPHDGGTYEQAPFEECSPQTYEVLLGSLRDVDLSKITEEEDNTDLTGELACVAGGCEIT